MTREEILERIRIGEEYLDRDDLTPKQRKQAEERYTELVARLAKMPEEPVAEPETSKEPEEDDKVLACMNKIRSILDMPLKEKIE